MVYSDFTKQDYQIPDFLRLIEQRIRKEIRQHQLIDTKKRYVLAETASLASKVLLHFLKEIFAERLVLEEKGETISTDYLENYVAEHLEVFLEAKSTEKLFEKKLMPLRSVTIHEIKEVAKILKLEGEVSEKQNEIINSLQEKYPQTKPSFIKSFIHIQDLNTLRK